MDQPVGPREWQASYGDEPMNTTASTLNLAHRIGLYRIALTVERFYDQLESHPGLTDPVLAFDNDPG